MPALTSSLYQPATTTTTTTIQPLPSRSLLLSRLLVRLRNKMETTKRRTWYELQRTHYYTNPSAIQSTHELATALQHFHCTVSDDELTLLMASFRDDSNGGFSFKRLAGRLYPMDREAGWGFESGSNRVLVSERGVSERPRSGANKVGVTAAAAVSSASPLAATTSAFPVVYASPSSFHTAPTNSSNKAATTTSAICSSKTSTSIKPATITTTTHRSATLPPSSNRTSALLHHSSRYVKQSTSIGRVYTERMYDSKEHESQRTAYIKYVNDGYWTRV